MRPKVKRKAVNDNNIGICYLYAIGLRNGDEVFPYTKIGISDNVDRRLKDMSTSLPFDAFCAHKVAMESRTAAFRAEGIMHSSLADLREKGEWFRISPYEAAAMIGQVIGSESPRVKSFLRHWNSYGDAA